MTNSANWRPTAGVSHGEQSHQTLFMEGPIYWRNPTSGDWVRLSLVEDSENPGIYVFQVDTQSADNQLP